MSDPETPDPVLGLWRQRQQTVARATEYREQAVDEYESGNLSASETWNRKADALESDLYQGVERRICRTCARSAEGLLAQARLLVDYLGDAERADDNDALLADTLMHGLEILVRQQDKAGSRD